MPADRELIEIVREAYRRCDGDLQVSALRTVACVLALTREELSRRKWLSLFLDLIDYLVMTGAVSIDIGHALTAEAVDLAGAQQ